MEPDAIEGMQTIALVLGLLLTVVLSGAVARILPLPIPRPLFQIVFGGVVGIMSGVHVPLQPDIFFLLFLPPLLFLDGWRIPREELFKDRVIVLELAFGLVLLTVVGVGYFIDWMIPSMPFAVCFALAAVVSPTDPIAVSAIAQRVPIPKRMMHILEGESLLNDASGLVCLRFAKLAAVTGAFSLYDAAFSFAWLVVGGIAIGTAITWAVTRAKDWVSRRFGEESGSQILISLLIPFGSYMVAEHLHCSGVLAAVAAGITMSFAEARGTAEAVTRIRRSTVWDSIQYTANGVIFVLLGWQLPEILRAVPQVAREAGLRNGWELIGYIVAIQIGLLVMRAGWVFVSLKLTLWRQGRTMSAPSWRVVGAMSFAGVRGAISLAAVLTLPLELQGRELAVTLAMGVILMSLVLASLFLPWLLRDLDLPQDAHDAAEDRARIAAAQAAIAEIERLEHQLAEKSDEADLYVTAAAHVMEVYRQRIERGSAEGEAAKLAKRTDHVERELRLAGLRAERREIFRLVRRRELGSADARHLVRELDLLEARYAPAAGH